MIARSRKSNYFFFFFETFFIEDFFGLAMLRSPPLPYDTDPAP